MSDLGHDVLTLLGLRWTLFLRSGLTRYTRTARSAAPVRLLVMLGIGVWVLAVIVLPVTLFLTSTLQGEQGRSLLLGWLEVLGSGAMVITLFYGIVTLLSTLTYRSDLQVLLLTPISPRLILGMKLLGTSLGFSLLLALALPALYGVDRQLSLGPWFLIATLIVILLLPLGPVSLAALLVLAVMRVVPPARARAVSTFLGTLMGAGVFIFQQVAIIGRRDAYAPATAPRLPAALPTTWPGHTLAAVAQGDAAAAVRYGLLIAVPTLLLFVASVELSARLFETGVVAYREVGRGRRVHHPFPRSGAAGRPWLPEYRPIWWPLFVKEWLMLRRDSQRLAGMAYPLLILVFYLWQATRLRGPDGPGSQSIFAGSLAGILLFGAIVLLNSVAPTVVNREGRSLYLLALAPVSARDIFASKWAIAAVPPMLVTAIALVAGAVATSASFWHAVVLAIVLSGFIVALTAASIAVNLVWPKLNATSPRKQTSRIASFVSLPIEGILGLVSYLALSYTFGLWPTSPLGSVLTCLGLLALLCGVAAGAMVVGSRLLARLLVSDRVAR